MAFERESPPLSAPLVQPGTEHETGLVRFVPQGDASAVLIGQPVDSSVDVGVALRKGEKVKVQVFSGTSVLSAGEPTDKVVAIARVLSPLATEEVGTIRCIGLNVSPPISLLGGGYSCGRRQRGREYGCGLLADSMRSAHSTRAMPRRPRWR